MCRPTKRNRGTPSGSPAVVQSEESSILDFKTMDITSKQMEEVSFAPEVVIQQQPASKQTFVFTTYEMVSDENNAKAVGFDSTGTLIQIRDATLFGEQVLPKYFRHRNVTSFYRQLNSYGFRTIKTSSVEVSHTFVCDMFRRDRPDLLPTIVRKKAAPPPPALAAAQQQFKQRAALVQQQQQQQPAVPALTSIAALPQQPQAMADDASVMRMIQELKDFQRNQQARALQLEENIRRLSSENSRILREGEQVISSMHGMVMNQKNVIQRLFGNKASEAFEAQLKAESMVMPVAPVTTTPSPQANTFPMSPLGDMDLFGFESTAANTTSAAVASPAISFEETKFVLPDDDLLELETLLAFEDDGFNF